MTNQQKINFHGKRAQSIIVVCYSTPGVAVLLKGAC